MVLLLMWLMQAEILPLGLMMASWVATAVVLQLLRLMLVELLLLLLLLLKLNRPMVVKVLTVMACLCLNIVLVSMMSLHHMSRAMSGGVDL